MTAASLGPCRPAGSPEAHFQHHHGVLARFNSTDSNGISRFPIPLVGDAVWSPNGGRAGVARMVDG